MATLHSNKVTEHYADETLRKRRSLKHIGFGPKWHCVQCHKWNPLLTRESPRKWWKKYNNQKIKNKTLKLLKVRQMCYLWVQGNKCPPFGPLSLQLSFRFTFFDVFVRQKVHRDLDVLFVDFTPPLKCALKSFPSSSLWYFPSYCSRNLLWFSSECLSPTGLLKNPHWRGLAGQLIRHSNKAFETNIFSFLCFFKVTKVKIRETPMCCMTQTGPVVK